MDGITESKMHAFLRQAFDHLEQMAYGTCQAVDRDDNERVAGGNVAQQLAESRPGARCPGAMLLDDHSVAGGTQLHLLRFGRLFVRGYTSVAYQAVLWSTGNSFLCLSSHFERLRAAHRSVFQT